ncbi:MAG: hypothetical protein LBL61_03205 [Elusimicrobiota bacterium]|jgi:hypothetical protein|nr:hypothetical protein [Elusimicrobiota bacterium]
MKTARPALALLSCLILSACAGPSLRYKKDVNALFEKGSFEAAAAKIEENKEKAYGKKDELLYLLDLGSAQNAALQNGPGNESLALAQEKIEELSVQSISANLGTLALNDYTQPYRARVFERAFTYFLRGLDYLALGAPDEAAVEARRAVFFLDNIRESKSGYNDDAFVQYFASLIFEDRGLRSDARISRANARNAYEKQKGESSARLPDFPPPPDYADKGEVIIFHLNGRAPQKISRAIMFAWNDIWFTLQGNSDLEGVQSDIISAVYAGAFGNSVTVSFPELRDESYIITSSSAQAGEGPAEQTQLAADISAAAKQTLDDEIAAERLRMITRAAVKYILSVQARHAAKKISGDDTVGSLVGMAMSVLSNATEKADTRSWFTLPAQVRVARLFLPPGQHDIKLVSYDGAGRAVDEHVFEKVQINKGGRQYLYLRTAK